MKKLKYLLLIVLSVSYSCNNKTTNSNLSTSRTDLAENIKTIINTPSKDDILFALEEAIDFCNKANREEFRKYLNVSEEQINSVSEEEFIEIKKDNIYLYENIIDPLRNDELSFQILSNENNIFKIGFIEKEKSYASVVMYFSYNKDNVLVLDSLNTH